MRKDLFRILLGMILLFGLKLPHTTLADSNIPDGFIPVYDEEDLDQMRENLSGQYILMNDLDLTDDVSSGGVFYHEGKGWESIGSPATPFRGTFNGNGHTIKGMMIRITSDQIIYAGLFGYAKGAVIQNVGMQGDVIDVENTSVATDSSQVYAGSLVGYSNGGLKMDHVFHTGSITAQSVYRVHAGGLVGMLSNDSISDSYNTGSVAVKTETGDAEAGGMAGYGYKSTIKNSYNTGSITTNSVSNYTYTGGIIGHAYETDVSNSFNRGGILTSGGSSGYAGGILGSFIGGTQTGVYNTGQIQSSGRTFGYAGGISGGNYGGVINRAYNSGSVNSNNLAGGISGILFSSASLSNSYNTGTITVPYISSASSGGLTASNMSSLISGCYNIGNLVGNGTKGGIVGNNSGVIKNTYHYMNGTRSVHTGSTDGITQFANLTDFEKQENVSNLNFDSIWTMGASPSYTYPELQDTPQVNDSGSGIYSFTLTSLPERTLYRKGEPIDLKGASLLLKTTAGTSEVVPVTEEMITGYQPGTTGVQTVMVQYENWTAAFRVTVKESFTVTFKDHDGTVLKTEDVPYATEVTPPNEPSRTGYTFKGWDQDLQHLTSDVTATAQYSINTYKVTFQDYDGRVLDTKIVNYSSDAEEPSYPSRTGYTFTGWDQPFTNITNELIVTAQYEINSYKVTFKDNMGEVLKSEVVEYGKPATPPGPPVLEGYEFVRWNLPFDYVTRDLTIFPQYQLKQYTVTFLSNGEVYATRVVNYGSSPDVRYLNPSRYGYLFKGWDQDLSNVRADITTNAIFEAKQYPISFYNENGSFIETQMVPYGQSATPPVIKKTGYTLSGWRGGDYQYVTGSIALYAEFKINQYQVDFKVDGKTASTQAVSYGSKAKAPYVPYKSGYTFVGWVKNLTDTTSFNLQTTVTSPLVLQAKYAKNPAIPGAPKVTNAGYTKLKVSWSKVTGVAGYEVYRATSKTGTYSKVASLNGSTLSYVNGSLKTNTTYYYKIRAYQIVNGVKVYSSYTGVVYGKPVLALPTGLKVVKYTSSSFKIAWTKGSEATGYELYRSTSLKGTYTKVATTTGTSYINKGIVKGKVYYYKIRAYKTVNKTKIYSSYSNPVSGKIY
ncbi:hypothetical protein G6549_13850 [Bacillus sp. MM2020_1]|nr:hypothetical protein [Bacillus sp. MM2020_1]